MAPAEVHSNGALARGSRDFMTSTNRIWPFLEHAEKQGCAKVVFFFISWQNLLFWLYVLLFFEV